MAEQDDSWLLDFLLEAPAGSSGSGSHASRSFAAAAPEAAAASRRSATEAPEAAATSVEEEAVQVEDTESEMLMPGSHMGGSSDEVRLITEPPFLSEGRAASLTEPHRGRSRARQRKFPTGVSFAVVKNPVYEAGVLRRFTPQQVLELCKDKIRGAVPPSRGQFQNWADHQSGRPARWV